jgi:hypothetical protein
MPKYIPITKPKFERWYKDFTTFIRTHSIKMGVSQADVNRLFLSLNTYHDAYTLDKQDKKKAQNTAKKGIHTFLKKFVIDNPILTDEQRREMGTPKFVETPEEIIKNFREFMKIKQCRNNPALEVFRVFEDFRHWYYFPEDDAFAPSKYLGYKLATLENYKGYGDGRDTVDVLKKYFNELDKHSEEFEHLYKKLERFSEEIGMKLHQRIKDVKGSGEIHIWCGLCHV